MEIKKETVEQNETIEPKAKAPSDLDIAANVLVRMEGLGVDSARRFLGRCTPAEVKAIAKCDAPLDCSRQTGDRFQSVLGTIMDEILKRQEVDETTKAKSK